VTKWKEIPLRTMGEYWPGLSTRNGRLMKRMGELADCKNINIQPFDTLAKRNGLVRAFDERFAGVVCGLFAYTDHCGNEYVLVADQTGFSIRTPFSLPQFQIADCYPFDAFAVPGEMNQLKWRNTSRYTVADDSMLLAVGAAVLADDLQVALDAAARWFKDACTSSYQTRIGFGFEAAAAPRQRIVQVVRGFDELATFGCLFAVLDFKAGDSYLLRLMHRQADASIAELNRLALDPVADPTGGVLTLAYRGGTVLVLEATLELEGRAAVTLTAPAINGAQDADLGLVSAVGIVQVEAGARPGTLVSVIDGGPV
jgi:hypothetical protein